MLSEVRMLLTVPIEATISLDSGAWLPTDVGNYADEFLLRIVSCKNNKDIYAFINYLTRKSAYRRIALHQF
jgi:hypothetical protein